MLKIFTKLDSQDNLIRSCDAVFNVLYENEWLEDERVINIINTVDKTEVVTNNILKSEFLGTFPPEKLSGGCKGLILMLKCDEPFIYSSAIFGDDCLKYIFQISQIKDIEMYLCSYLFMENYENMQVSIQDVSTGEYFSNYDEYFKDVLKTASKYWGNGSNKE